MHSKKRSNKEYPPTPRNISTEADRDYYRALFDPQIPHVFHLASGATDSSRSSIDTSDSDRQGEDFTAGIPSGILIEKLIEVPKE